MNFGEFTPPPLTFTVRGTPPLRRGNFVPGFYFVFKLNWKKKFLLLTKEEWILLRHEPEDEVVDETIE